MEIEQWVASTVDAMEEVLGTLGFGPGDFGEPEPAVSPLKTPEGGVIALVNEDYKLELAILCAHAGAENVAQKLLMLEPGEADEELIRDAICEMCNILAGALKSRAQDSDIKLQLGLPNAIQGQVTIGRGNPAHTVEFQVGGEPLRLAVSAVSAAAA